MNPALILFLSGMLAAGYLVVAGFFLRFWRQTRERLFLYFCVAFVLLAIQRAILVPEFGMFEDKTWAYGLRLVAFLVILYGIVEKNRAQDA
jgi:hypothetical protein